MSGYSNADDVVDDLRGEVERLRRNHDIVSAQNQDYFAEIVKTRIENKRLRVERAEVIALLEMLPGDMLGPRWRALLASLKETP